MTLTVYSISRTTTIPNDIPKYVCAGQKYVSILTEKGKIYSAGDNSFGQFGDGTTKQFSDSLVPTASSLNFTSMRCGSSSVVALSSDGDIYFWGSFDNIYSTYSNNRDDSLPITVPLRIRSQENAKFSSISVGIQHLLGVSLDRKKLYIYGKNYQLSFGNSVEEYKELTPIDTIPKNRTIIEATAVSFYTYLMMECSPGQYGEQCERYDCFGIESTSNYTCNGKGRCVSPNTCECFVNSTLIDSNCVNTCFNTNEQSKDVCSGQGLCISKDNCICNETHGGERCEYSYCFGLLSINNEVCNAQGVCVAPNICQCKSGYFGETCRIHVTALILPPIVSLLLIVIVISSSFIVKRFIRFKKDYDITKVRFKDVEMELLVKNKKLDTIDANYYIDPNHLEFDQRRGGGSYADVFKGTYKGAPVAIKLMKKSVGEEIDEEFEKEINILKSLHHPNIVQLVGLAKTSNNMMIVTDFMEGGSLDQFIKSKSKVELSFTKKVKLLADVAMGMTRLHHLDPPLVHRDLKPANILIDAGATLAKVCDFGVSNFLQTEDDINFNTGTDGYQPPEVLSGFNSDSSWDVYSFAIVMYEILHETSAYSHINKFQIHEQVKRGCRPAHQRFVDLMCQCWSQDCQVRPKFEQIVRELQVISSQSRGH
ncbi:serine/threonine-protein kinase/receptor [Acrasis kona]|uniref:Serine/threonine-protein kinase/receptor n=1 Tax=Acrasis kona TaxID=1008807 RepID=A0AAW2Z8L2_9EUKA